MKRGAATVMNMMAPMNAADSSSPGTTPARNMSPTDCSATKA
jgi:hypothetical protein